MHAYVAILKSKDILEIANEKFVILKSTVVD